MNNFSPRYFWGVIQAASGTPRPPLIPLEGVGPDARKGANYSHPKYSYVRDNTKLPIGNSVGYS